MNRVQEVFQNKAFVPFVTAGDPNLDVTERLIVAMAEAGADLIEIGIPFSDPVAEGIVIQEADQRALDAGTTTDKIFDMVKRVRTKTDVPLAFMTYINRCSSTARTGSWNVRWKPAWKPDRAGYAL